jgi:hypothetical protein
MSDLFNLTRILSENSYPQLVQSVENRTYLSNGIDLLRETNENILEATRDLYIALAEAETKSAENVNFADFFKRYKDVIDKYILKARELQSQFEINVETFADANSDIIDVNDGSDIMATPKYVGVEYDNLLDPDVPDIEPRKAFKKEFAFIGKLLQDLGPIASEEAKAQVIATVCNNLSSEISDGWLDKVIEHITDEDDCDKDGFARAMYKKFVKDPHKEMTVDIGLVKQCKLSIMNNTSYIASVDKSVTSFCDGLFRVADEIGSMFFRNRDHKLPIETDAEGVEDKTYRLNDYSFNQMNMFISTKITQITELCNLYIIALTIKMDCIMKYLQQCKDIISTATDGIDNTPNDDTDPGDAEQELDDEELDDDSSDDPEPDTDDGEEDPEEIDIKLQAQSEDDDDENDSDPEDGFNTDESGVEPLHDNSEDDFEEACYLFEADAFQAERLITEMMFRESMINYLSEDATGTDKPGIRPGETASAIIQKLMARFQNLVVKFITKFSGYDKQAAYIKKNRGKITRAKIPENWTIQKMNMTELEKFVVPNLVEEDLGLLGNKDKYLTAKYGEKSGTACKILSDELEGSSVKDRIMKLCLDETETPYNEHERDESMNFVTQGYQKCISNIKNAQSRLKSAQSNAKTFAKESAVMYLEATMMAYFGESDENQNTDGDGKTNGNTPNPAAQNDGKAPQEHKDNVEVPKDQENNGNIKRSNAARLYFAINTGVIVAVMNTYNKAMKKHLKFVKTLAKIGGVVGIPSDNATDENQEQNTNNNQK